MRYRFGRFELQPGERRLLADGVLTPVTPRAFDLLVALVERAGLLVGKDELLARVWPKLVVEESNLQVQVSALRKFIGSDAIETVVGSGYRFLLDVQAVGDEPPPAREARKHNLPRAMTRFIAPDGQVEACARMLDDTRLLTLTGAGGLGKTRLSQEMAETRIDHYKDGVWLVELAPVVDARMIPQAVAVVLGVQDTVGGDLLEIVKHHVKERRMLLLLDNCEHLLQACAEFAKQLLQTSPNLKVLATSREALHLAGEATLPMVPLGVPADGPNMPSLELLARYEAVRLFVDRATAAQPSFVLTQDNARAVAQICIRLDGIPLAIELAAARSRVMSANAIAERLHDRFRLLKGADRTATPRHHTLEATIDWSYDLLTPAEQRLLQRLSAFSGGWTLEAAEAVGGSDDRMADADVFDLLAELVEKSLVAFDQVRSRYYMLETIRQYAHSRLESAGIGDDARQRHLTYYLALAEREGRRLYGPDEESCNALLDIERDNVRAAYTWSSHTEERDGYAESLLLAAPMVLPQRVRAGSPGPDRCAGGLARHVTSRDAGDCLPSGT